VLEMGAHSLRGKVGRILCYEDTENEMKENGLLGDFLENIVWGEKKMEGGAAERCRKPYKGRKGAGGRLGETVARMRNGERKRL